MLSLAYEKTLSEGLGIHYVQQDMCRLEGFMDLMELLFTLIH